MNSTREAAVCFPHTPRGTGDWGRGLGIAYICASAGDTGEAFRRVLQHECGHGFAKLEDEYIYDGNDGSGAPYHGPIPASTKSSRIREYERFGWRANVDFSANIAQTRWGKFATADPRYTRESQVAGLGSLGCYEGARYLNGIWRATAAQSPIKMGEMSMELAYRYLGGETLEAEYLIDPFIVSPANIEQYGQSDWQ